MAGYCFAEYIIPLLEEIVKVLCVKLEIPRYKDSETINDCEIRMKKALSDSELEETEVKTIGFTIPEEITIEEEDDE